MAAFRKYIYALAIVALIAGLTVPVSAQTTPLQCTANAGSPPFVRSQGLAELVGDIIIDCVGGTGTAGQVLTVGTAIPSTGSGLTWQQPSNIGPNWANPWQNDSSLKVKGDAEFYGEITIQGVKLGDRLNKIEERLAILRPNEKLEEKWERLKELGDEYRKLEQEIIEKLSIFFLENIQI